MPIDQLWIQPAEEQEPTVVGDMDIDSIIMPDLNSDHFKQVHHWVQEQSQALVPMVGILSLCHI